MDYQELILLIKKMEDQTASADELQKLDEFYHSFEERENYTDYISDLNAYENVMSSRIRSGIAERTGNQKRSVIKMWSRISVAASILLVIGLGAYFYKDKLIEKSDNQKQYATGISPGKNGATLTLANGTKIKLGDATNGELATEAGVRISKIGNGQLAYEITKADYGQNKINMLSTERGETFQLRLPDGSMVWLNSASSLSFNVSLTKHHKRVVKLNGEAYFEVAKDKTRPFIVETFQQKIEVLGTHFNVNAYQGEESVKTTLLEGSVRILSSDLQQVILKPEQQSITTIRGIKVIPTDTAQIIAWKSGLFMFEDENLENIMKMISRWYNVDIHFETEELKQKTFSGSFSRFTNVSQVLEKIESTHSVRFTIKDRKITLLKY